MSTTPTIETKLLLAAAAFIRKHPNGTDDAIKALMADAVDEAARKLGGLAPLPAVALASTVPAPAAGTPPKSDGMTDVDIAIMLRAAGYKNVKGPTLEVYGFMLRNHARAWSASTLAKKLRRGSSAINHILSLLADRGAIVKTDKFGFYRAT